MTKLFWLAKIKAMQSKKASNKTAKKAEDITAPGVDNGTTGEVNAKPRAARSSKPKSETAEAMPGKRHRAVTPAASQETTPVAEMAPRTMATAAGANHSSTVASVIDSVGPDAAGPSSTTGHNDTILTTGAIDEVTSERIAALAHSYWVARGHSHGASEEDWLRAERELQNRN